MTDYSQMSDKQINDLVDSHIYDDIENAPDSDYCNNPADAWPIIISNRIAVIPASNSDEWAANHGDWDIFTKDSNPLRAAMIVFLKMQDYFQC